MDSTSDQPQYWRKCTTCKKPLGFAGRYWVCSVSTCNRARTGLVFCSVSCFDAHIPVMNHRDAGAFERRTPSLSEWRRERDAAAQPRPRPSSSATASPAPVPRSPQPAPENAPRAEIPLATDEAANSGADDEILVVVSKVKAYIRYRSGMNTSDTVMEVLTNFVRNDLKDAIRRAAQDGRKTVLDRDFR